MKDYLIKLSDAIAALGEEPLVWNDNDYDLGTRNQWEYDVECLKEVPPARTEPLTIRVNHELTKEEYEKLMHDIKDAPIVLLPSVQPAQRWIPCSERLPEAEKKNYWVCTDTGYQCECRWTNVNHFWTNLTTEWHWHIMDTPQYSKVIAWMLLPEPYTERKKDERYDLQTGGD